MKNDKRQNGWLVGSNVVRPAVPASRHSLKLGFHPPAETGRQALALLDNSELQKSIHISEGQRKDP